MTYVSKAYKHWVEDLQEVDLDKVYEANYETYGAFDRNYLDFAREVRDKLRGRLRTRDIRFATYKPLNDDHPNYWIYEQGDLMPMGYISTANKTVNRGYVDEKTYQVFRVKSPHVNNQKYHNEIVHSKSRATAVKKALGVLHNRTLGEIAEMHTYGFKEAISTKKNALDKDLEGLIKSVCRVSDSKYFLQSNAFTAMTNPAVFEVLSKNVPDVANTITQIHDAQNTIKGFKDTHDSSRVVFVHCKENDATVIWSNNFSDYDHTDAALVRHFRVGEFPELEQRINSLSIMDSNDAVLDVGMKVRDNLYFVVISQVPSL